MYGVSHQGVRGEPCTLLWMKMLGESGFVSRIVLFHSSLLCEPLRAGQLDKLRGVWRPKRLCSFPLIVRTL